MSAEAVELAIYLPLAPLAVLETFWWGRFLTNGSVPRAAWPIAAGALAFGVIAAVLVVSRTTAILWPGSLEDARQVFRVALALSAYTGLLALRRWRSEREA